MNILMRRLLVPGITVVALLFLFSFAVRGADTLPGQLTDDEFWKLVETSSEPSGSFLSENFTSNENGFQMVIPSLLQSTRPNGVYLGVGPEQNFTYIVAMHPKIAFIIDIRRQNLIEHLLYKAIFEMADNRADFLSLLFSCSRPMGLTNASSIDTMLNAYLKAYRNGKFDGPLFRSNLKSITERIVDKHGFKLSDEDLESIDHVYSVFNVYGPEINYNSRYPAMTRGNNNYQGANFTTVMVAADPAGQQRGFLASEENYRALRDYELKNLIVPVVGDFGGPAAIKAVGQYLKNHGATVSAFYTSNVEQYLFRPAAVNLNAGRGVQLINGGAGSFYNNVASLPIDEASVFIRSGVPAPNGAGSANYMNNSQIAPIQATLDAYVAGTIVVYQDIFKIRKPE